MDVATFRAVLPEFGNTDLYPDARIAFNIKLASDSLNPNVWGDRLEAGILYYAAHYTALGGTVATGGVAGGGSSLPAVPQLATGLVSSKSVGGVSVSYDNTVGQTEGGGAFNLTRYGQTFLTLLSSISIGVMQL